MGRPGGTWRHFETTSGREIGENLRFVRDEKKAVREKVL